MNKNFVFVVAAFLLTVKAEEKKAYCNFQEENGSGVSGYVTYTQAAADQPLKMHVDVSGLTPNQQHGFHIHEKGDLSDGCASQGDHYNPMNMNHGGLNDTVRHIGDLGNIQADSSGNVVTDISTSNVSIFGDYSIMGRGCSIHSGKDDLGKGGDAGSLKSGNSGHAIACGKIEEGEKNLAINITYIFSMIVLIFN